jgi:hypothetical protein
VRLIRQRRLSGGQHPIELTVIVDEVALRRPIGGSDVMRAQLRHVLDLAQEPGVQLTVLPADNCPHIGMDGAFILLDFPEPEDGEVLFIAHPAGAVHVEKEREVREARLIFEHLLESACFAEGSIELIECAAREW